MAETTQKSKFDPAEKLKDFTGNLTGANLAVATCMCSIMVALFITLVTYMGIYAFNNPDSSQCWVIKDLDSPMPSKEGAIMKAEALGITVADGYPVEIHKLFKVWFIWGFWAHIYLVVSSTCFHSLEKFCGGFGDIIGKISCAVYSI